MVNLVKFHVILVTDSYKIYQYFYPYSLSHIKQGGGGGIVLSLNVCSPGYPMWGGALATII